MNLWMQLLIGLLASAFVAGVLERKYFFALPAWRIFLCAVFFLGGSAGSLVISHFLTVYIFSAVGWEIYEVSYIQLRQAFINTAYAINFLSAALFAWGVVESQIRAYAEKRIL